MAKRNDNIPISCCSETIYESHYGNGMKESRSITIFIEYTWSRPTAIDVLCNDCGESCMEYYGDCDIEEYLHIRGDAAQKLAAKFSAHDGKTLLKRMADRFRPYGDDAFTKIEAWLQSKAIDYTTSLY